MPVAGNSQAREAPTRVSLSLSGEQMAVLESVSGTLACLGVAVAGADLAVRGAAYASFAPAFIVIAIVAGIVAMVAAARSR